MRPRVSARDSYSAWFPGGSGELDEPKPAITVAAGTVTLSESPVVLVMSRQAGTWPRPTPRLSRSSPDQPELTSVPAGMSSSSLTRVHTTLTRALRWAQRRLPERLRAGRNPGRLAAPIPGTHRRPGPGRPRGREERPAPGTVDPRLDPRTAAQGAHRPQMARHRQELAAICLLVAGPGRGSTADHPPTPSRRRLSGSALVRRGRSVTGSGTQP